MTRQQERSGFKLFTLLQDNEDGAFTKWRVENSWGEDHGHKGELKLVIPTQGAWSLLCCLSQEIQVESSPKEEDFSVSGPIG